jgi:glutamyl-tRNA synthetase
MPDLRLYRGRLAPSPTGLLHLGHAHTFWIAQQRALAANGTLVLRMDDLDPQRSKPQFAGAIIEDLHWLGINWQEGPYPQSKRYDQYRAAWEKLRAGGFIYPCRCSRKDLAHAVTAPHEDGAHELDDEPLYPGTCRPAAGTISTAMTNINWRFRVPEGEVVAFDDEYLGPQQFVAGRDFGDFLIWRRDDVPAYQLASVVDDAAMQITEVVRGADLLKSTARQILLNRALGYKNPAWFHTDLLRDEKGHRLAKRHDALSLRTLRARGLSPAECLRLAAQQNST